MLSLSEIYTRASVLFSKNFWRILKYYESKKFFYSSLQRSFESEYLRFRFSTKNNLKLTLAIVGNLLACLDKLRDLYMSQTFISNFS